MRQQQGLALGSTLVLLVLVGFFLLTVVRVVPMYMNNYKIKGAFTALQESGQLASMSQREIHSALGKRFDVNYIEHVKPADVKITRNSKGVKLELHYESRATLFYNLALVADFHHKIEVKR